ncbi:putative endo-arabinase [Seiridium cupressi]
MDFPDPSILQDLDGGTGAWTTGQNAWAPDVRLLSDGTYVVYDSGQVADKTAYHCVVAAKATSLLGPYTASDDAFPCDLSIGSAIDPSEFVNSDGKRYVIYKAAGSSIGHGGTRTNGVVLIIAAPDLLQEVVSGGVTRNGNAIKFYTAQKPKFRVLYKANL